MDDSKATAEDDNNRFGDLIIWFELLQLAENTKQNIFFICRDVKEDWIQKVAGKTIGPRMELILEFKKVAPDAIFHIYPLTQFLELFGDFNADESESIMLRRGPTRRRSSYFGIPIESIKESEERREPSFRLKAGMRPIEFKAPNDYNDYTSLSGEIESTFGSKIFETPNEGTGKLYDEGDD